MGPWLTGQGGLAAVVLAGGRSRRMGRDKATVEVLGEPLVVRVTRSVGQACDPVVVVAAPDQPLPALPSDARLARDVVAFEGPLSGLATGLAALDAAGPERAFVVGVDAVRTSAALAAALASFGAASDAVAVADEAAGPLPLPVILPVARALSAATALLAEGRRSLRALVESLDPIVVSRAELLAASPALAAADPDLLGLEDADDGDALRRLLPPGESS